MDSIWTNRNKSADSIIALGNNKLYKLNPSDEKMPRVLRDLKNGEIPKSALSIPFSYIKTVEWKVGKPFLLIRFGQDSEEIIRMDNNRGLQAVFKQLQEVDRVHYQLDEYSRFRAAKKPLWSVLLLTLVCIVLFLLARDIETEMAWYESMNMEYERKWGGLLGMIAHFGTTRIIWLYALFMAIAVPATFIKMKKPPVVHTLRFNPEPVN
ncbi:hypothetical protein KFE98_20685 [bacterium SCSIO 12741]|nr:hypothetical protein KFE98_20685 [bacterium SCSIO 12741]